MGGCGGRNDDFGIFDGVRFGSINLGGRQTTKINLLGGHIAVISNEELVAKAPSLP